VTKVTLSGANPYVPPEPGVPPVRVESMLFSMVEPNKGFEVAYNDWYERDHQISGGTVGLGWFSNRRWVATRRLKNLRFPVGGAMDPIDMGSLLSVYWREEGVAQSSEAWALEQWVWLNDRNRIFNERQHAHSATYRHLSTVFNPGERVPLELALMHPFEGLVMIMVDEGGAERGAVVADVEKIAGQVLLSDDLPILSSWEMLRAPEQAVAQRPPGTIAREPVDVPLLVGFTRKDPEAIWPQVQAFAEALSQGSRASVSYAAGFIPTVPGTTTHLDEL
jgi:hypothetical protein